VWDDQGCFLKEGRKGGIYLLLRPLAPARNQSSLEKEIKASSNFLFYSFLFFLLFVFSSFLPFSLPSSLPPFLPSLLPFFFPLLIIYMSLNIILIREKHWKISVLVVHMAH
jgi:hypothetical protein